MFKFIIYSREGCRVLCKFHFKSYFEFCTARFKDFSWRRFSRKKSVHAREGHNLTLCTASSSEYFSLIFLFYLGRDHVLFSSVNGCVQSKIQYCISNGIMVFLLYHENVVGGKRVCTWNIVSVWNIAWNLAKALWFYLTTTSASYSSLLGFSVSTGKCCRCLRSEKRVPPEPLVLVFS